MNAREILWFEQHGRRYFGPDRDPSLRPDPFLRHDAHRFLPRELQLRLNNVDRSPANTEAAFEAEHQRREAASTLRKIHELKSAIAKIRYDLAFERFKRAFLRGAYANRPRGKAGFRPEQLRVPANNPGGGQWTNTGGGVGRNDPRVISDATPDNSFKPGAQLAANDRLGYPINLYEEEAFGHTIAAHVNKTSESLINQAREAFIRDPDARDSRSGSFSSIEAATKLVNSTIARNQAIVDQVASGIRIRETVISYYPSITGIEAVVPSATSTGSIRETYGVGVVIIHDRLSLKGFRILTAFPTNR